VKRMCRTRLALRLLRRRPKGLDILRHARIVSDPEKLSYLNAEVAKRIVKSNPEEELDPACER
jgi:hypothetical protein